MSRLELRLLGRPEIRHGGDALSFTTRKTLPLLAYAAVEPGPHSREKLAAFFWPESDEAAARATLRSTLVRLQDALGREDGARHLGIERDQIWFATGSDCAIDIDRLAEAES